MPAAALPLLSAVLPTDSAATIQPVLESLRRQPEAHRIEVVLVTPQPAAVRDQLRDPGSFGALTVISVPTLSPLGPARATGIRAATADLVFLGETHSYPQEGWLEALQEEFMAGRWDVVACGMVNANPETLASRAGFLADYARWVPELPAGEIAEAPLYNAVYRREVLLALGARLDDLLSHGDGLKLALHARGNRAGFAPSARLTHVNLNQLPKALRERFLAGILIGKQRAERWTWARRLLYAAAAPLIAWVLWRRILDGCRAAGRKGGGSPGALALIFALQSVRAAGEFLGYLGRGRAAHQAEMDDLEIRKLAHCGRAR